MFGGHSEIKDSDPQSQYYPPGPASASAAIFGSVQLPLTTHNRPSLQSNGYHLNRSWYSLLLQLKRQPSRGPDSSSSACTCAVMNHVRGTLGGVAADHAAFNLAQDPQPI